MNCLFDSVLGHQPFKNMNRCLYCNAEIPEGRKFCSSSHSAKYNNSKRKKLTNTCSYCGKELVGWVNSRNKYCSYECAAKAVFAKKDKEYFDGKITEMHTLKKHYIHHNEYKCALCGLTEWNGKAITLILDHVDGNPDNNLPSNLRLVCPNCDSQLDTFKNRNKGKGRAYRRDRYAKGQSY